MKEFFKMDDDSRTSLEEPEEEELTFDDLIQRSLKQLQDRFLAEERAKAREEAYKKGFTEGYKVGYKVGYKRGRAEAKREIVLRMSTQGFSVDQIARAVDYDEDFVKSLQAEMK